MTSDSSELYQADKIERKIVRQILGFSLASLFVYLIHSAFFTKSEDVFVQSLVIFIFFSLLLGWTFINGLGSLLVKKRTVTAVIYLSVLAGFFTIGGLKGLTSFDIINMFIFLSVLYRGKERKYYLYIMFVTLAVLFFIQLQYPHIITNRTVNDPDWITGSNIFVRILLAINVGDALRSAYSVEHAKVTKLLKEVNDLNTDVTMQNEELKSMQEELRASNEKLEVIVQERTKKLELQNETLIMYAYLNSHVFRGPVCRIQGILNLLEIEKDDQVKKELNKYLFAEVHEIDKVIKDISTLLYETDPEMLEEIRLKAKRLYNL